MEPGLRRVGPERPSYPTVARLPCDRGSIAPRAAHEPDDALAGLLARAVRQRPPPVAGLLQRKAWETRRDEMLATLARRDPREAALVRDVLAGLPDRGRAISQRMSIGRGGGASKSVRDQRRADMLLEHVTATHLNPRGLVATIRKGADLRAALNSPQGFAMLRNALRAEVYAANPRESADALSALHDLGGNYTGTGACYSAGAVVTKLLDRAGIYAQTRHAFSKTSLRGIGRRDHVWTLVGPDTIIDATWKQFWKPREPDGGDPVVTAADWDVLNAYPDVFVGTQAEMAAIVEELNPRLSRPFDERYCDNTIQLYDVGAKQDRDLFMATRSWEPDEDGR